MLHFARFLFCFIAIHLTLTQAYTVDDHDKLVGCYYSSWAYYRPGIGQFNVSMIDPTLCTQVYYAFAGVNNETHLVDIDDPFVDLAPTDPDCLRLFPDDPEENCKLGGYREFVALKSRRPATQFLLSIGGWSEGSADFSVMAADPIKRAAFIEDAVRMCVEYGFDGIDLDWEYPCQREGGSPDDYDNYITLIEEAKQALHVNGRILTAAVPAGYPNIDAGYNVPEMSKHYDFMNIMGYDYAGSWNPFTSHNAPLYPRPEETESDSPLHRFNLYDTMKHYDSLGMPKEKAVLGIPLYSRGWTLEEGYENNPGMYCPTVDGNPMGPYTEELGYYGYYEILEAQNNGTLWNLPGATAGQWSMHRDNCYAAPHMVNGPYWMSYDDPASVAKKVQFINHLDLAGAMVWSIDTDDFAGTYGIKYPLLQAINDAFHTGNTFNPEDETCVPMASCV